MKPFRDIALFVCICMARFVSADTTINVVVIGSSPSDRENVIPLPDVKVRLIPEEATTGLIGYTDSQGKTSIRFDGSRSFVLEVAAGPGQWVETNRMYGKVDHTTSIYLGPSPSYAKEDAFGDTGKAILAVAEDSQNGLPERLKHRFEDNSIDREIEELQKSGELTQEEVDEYREGLKAIRNAPTVRRPITPRKNIPIDPVPNSIPQRRRLRLFQN